MKLEYPLSDVLPSIDHARDRLLARIYRYRQEQEALLTTDEDSALLYAYSEYPGYCRSHLLLLLLTLTRLALVTGQLSQEISEILADVGQLFGVLSEDILQMA